MNLFVHIGNIVPYILLIFLLVTSNLGFIDNNSLRKIALYVLFFLLIIKNVDYKKTSYYQRLIIKLFFISGSIIAYEHFVKEISLFDDWIISILMDVGMIWMGVKIASTRDKSYFISLLKWYVIICSLACVYSLITFDSSNIYEFKLKNSQTPIYLISSIILLTRKECFNNWINKGLLGLHIITLLRMNSRSSVVAFCISAIILLYIERKQLKQLLIGPKKSYIAIITIIVVILLMPKIIGVVSTALRLETLELIDLDRYSADRIPMILMGLKYFDGHEILGIANEHVAPSSFYIESFPFEVLVQLGIIGFIFYFVWFYTIYRALQKNKCNKTLGLIVFAAILVICLFESNAPMSPGSTYAFAWLVIGYHCNSCNKGYSLY